MVVGPLVASCGCETMEVAGDSGGGTVTVAGTRYYPDESGTTFIVPEGARIVGAGGQNCRYVVEWGGSLTAHAGEDNTYEIESGGRFQGFVHPATRCTVRYESGAIVEVNQRGPGTRFVAEGGGGTVGGGESLQPGDGGASDSPAGASPLEGFPAGSLSTGSPGNPASPAVGWIP